MQPTKALVTLRYITRIAAVIVLVAVAVGFFLPADYRIERSITVTSDNVESVQQRLFSAQAWPNWMYIEGGELSLESQSGEGLTSQSTFSISYDANVDRRGTLELVQVSSTQIEFVVTPNEKTRPVPNRIAIQSLDNGQLEVIWVIEGELDAGFLSPYLALVANTIAGSNIEASLTNLAQ